MVDKINNFRKKKAVQRVRDELNFWGCDVSDLTDDEITKGIEDFSKALAEVGMKALDAAKALLQIRIFSNDKENKHVQ